MPLYSVGDMLTFVGKKLNGTGVDPSVEPGLSQALEGLNSATRMLMVEDRCVVDGYLMLPVSAEGVVTLDYRVKEITEAKVLGSNMMPVVGQGAYFLDGAAYDRTTGEACHASRLEFAGDRHVLHQKFDMPRMLFAISDNPADSGKELLITGCDAAGNSLRTSGSLGLMVPITNADCNTAPVLACNGNVSSTVVADITMIRKPVTAGYVQLWGYDQNTGSVHWLTTIPPSVVSPSFTKYQLRGWAKGAASLFAHVVLKYEPMIDLNDISLIQQPDAIEVMVQAIAARDTGDYNTFQTYRNAALAYIRKDRRHERGTDFRLNVRTSKMPLRGQSFSMRPNIR